METNSTTQWAIIGTAVIILLAGGSWLIGRSKVDSPVAGDNPLAATTEETETTNSVVPDGVAIPTGAKTVESDGESVVIENQAAAGSVKISSMSLTRATWVAVRDERSILGAKWFSSNATSGEMRLLRNTEAGTTYQVLFYVDDGDKKFDHTLDILVTSEGKPVGTSFTAQ